MFSKNRIPTTSRNRISTKAEQEKKKPQNLPGASKKCYPERPSACEGNCRRWSRKKTSELCPEAAVSEIKTRTGGLKMAPTVGKHRGKTGRTNNTCTVNGGGEKIAGFKKKKKSPKTREKENPQSLLRGRWNHNQQQKGKGDPGQNVQGWGGGASGQVRANKEIVGEKEHKRKGKNKKSCRERLSKGYPGKKTGAGERLDGKVGEPGESRRLQDFWSRSKGGSEK